MTKRRLLASIRQVHKRTNQHMGNKTVWVDSWEDAEEECSVMESEYNAYAFSVGFLITPTGEVITDKEDFYTQLHMFDILDDDIK